MNINSVNVKFDEMCKEQFNDANEGIVTLIGASWTSLVDVGLSTVEAGDFIYVTWRASLTKGGVAGDCSFRFEATAGPDAWSIGIYNAGPVTADYAYVNAAGFRIATGTIIFRAFSAAGPNVVLSLKGYSAGSDSTVAVEECQVRGAVFY